MCRIRWGVSSMSAPSCCNPRCPSMSRGLHPCAASPAKHSSKSSAVLPYTDIATVVVRMSRDWHALRSSDQFRAERAAVDERGLVVVGEHLERDGDVSVPVCPMLTGCRCLALLSFLRRRFAASSTSSAKSSRLAFRGYLATACSSKPTRGSR